MPSVPRVRSVVDTNTLVSGSLWNGPPARLLQAIRTGEITLVQSPRLWAEFVAVMNRPKFSARLRSAGLTPTLLADGLRRYVSWTSNATIPLPPDLQDPKDLMVLACAASAEADVIVTGDEDLLSLKSFDGIPIPNVRGALEKLGLPPE